MSAGDKVQIVLSAQDEVSDKVRATKANLKSLKAEMTALSKELDKPGNSQRWDELQRKHSEAKRDLLDLSKQSAKLKREFDTLTKPAEAGVGRLSRAADTLTRKLGITGGAADRLKARMGTLDSAAYRFRARWSSAIDAVHRKLDGLKTKISGFGTLLKGGAFAAGAGMVGLGIVGLKTSSQLEQSQIALEQMTGSAEKAGRLMEWLKETSARTPFELAGLTQATQRMLAYGFSIEDAQRNLMIVGDAASATGLGQEGIDRISTALGQMQAKQKIAGEEMRQLTEAGIPAWQMLADKMGMTVPQLQAMVETQGGAAKVFGRGGLPKLLDAMGEKYDGLMGKQSKTLGGLLSTLKDTVALGAAELINKWLPQIKAGLTGLINGAGNAFSFVSGVVDKVAPVVTSVITFIGQNREAFIAAAAAIGVMTLAMGALAIATNATGIPALIFAIGALVGLLVLAYKRVDWFRTAVDTAFRWIRGAVSWFVDWFGKYAWPAIRLYFRLWAFYISKVVWPVLRTVFRAIGKVIGWVWDFVGKVWWPGMRQTFGAFIRVGRAVWESAKSVWHGVSSTLANARDRIVGIIDGIRSGFSNLWSGIADGVGSAVQTIIDWIGKIPGMSWLADTIAGARFAGGPVWPGNWLVGEMGPELFVPSVGAPRMVGESGPEVRTLGTGVVIPNHLLAAVPPQVRGERAPAVVQSGPSAPLVGTMVVQREADAVRELQRFQEQSARVAAERGA